VGEGGCICGGRGEGCTFQLAGSRHSVAAVGYARDALKQSDWAQGKVTLT
jgi:hypothetical protein